jgi:hypothetical protein
VTGLVRDEHRCAACGGPRADTDAIDCAECGRPLGVCADPDCGWFVRLFQSDDAADCENCGWREKDPNEDARLLATNGPCPDCGGPRHSPDGRCLSCSTRRSADVRRQMRERSGPWCERSTARGRIVYAAWRAAGSPQRPRGPLIGCAVLTGRPVYAAPAKDTAEWRAWQAWQRERSPGGR